MCASNKLSVGSAHNINTVKIPPDGHWGWAVTLAYAVFNFIYLASLSNFTIIYYGKIENINLSPIDLSIITNVHCAISMFMTIMAGPLVNQFGYRFVALAAGVAISSGIILSAFAHNFISFLITYGIIPAVGFGFGHGTFILALNAYFTTLRHKANCLALAIASIGPIIGPIFLTQFTTIYGTIGSILIIGAISAHIIMAAMLLQPVEWHLKESLNIISNTMDTRNKPIDTFDEYDDQIVFDFSRDFIQKRQTSITDVAGTSTNTYNRLSMATENTSNSIQNTKAIKPKLPTIAMSLGEIDAFTSMLFNRVHFRQFNNHHIESYEDHDHSTNYIHLNTLSSSVNGGHETHENFDQNSQKNSRSTKAKISFFKTSVYWTTNLVDLYLLKNKLFLSMISAMGLSVFAELNFTILTPFILSDLNYSSSEIITFISTIPIASVLIRILSAHFGQNVAPKVLFLFSLLLTIVSRIGLYVATSFQQLLIVALIVSLANGIRLAHIQMVIPSCVYKRKITPVAGIQILVNGLCLLIFGPIIGWIRNATGDYIYCLMFLTAMPFIHFLVLAFEMIYTQWKNIEQNNVNEDD